MLFKLILIIIFTYSCFVSYSQINYLSNTYNPNNTWASGMSIEVVGNDCFVVSVGGDMYSGTKNIMINKIDSAGELVYTNNYGHHNYWSYPGLSNSITHHPNNYFVLGGSHAYSSYSCGYIFAFDYFGDSLWSKEYHSQSGNYMALQHASLTNDNGFVFCGNVDRDPYVDGNIILIKTDSLGNEQWQNTYVNTSKIELSYNVAQTSDDGYLIGGHQFILGNDYSGNAIAIKVDSNGEYQWKRIFDSGYEDGIARVASSTDGNCVIAYTKATYQAPPYPPRSPWLRIEVTKVSNQNQLIWQQSYGSSWQFNYIQRIKEIPGQGYLIGGYAWSDTIFGAFQGWLLKINYWGDSIWYREYNHYQNLNSSNKISDFSFDSNGSIITSGESYRFIPGYPQEIWLQKLDSSGCVYFNCDPTVRIYSDDKILSDIPNIFPNPVIDKLRIQFNNDIHCRKLQIYNSDGVKIKEALINMHDEEIVVEASHWTAGLYICIFFLENRIHYQKVIKL